MKQQILFSPDADGNSNSNEPVKRLSERYGIPERDVEALLYGSRAPKSEALGSDMKEKLMPDEFRPVYQIPPPQKQGGWSPVNVLSAIVGILGVLALTIILIAVLKRHDFYHHPGDMPPPPLAVPERPHPVMPDSAKSGALMNTEKPEDVPPPATRNEIENKPTAPRSSARSTRRASSSAGFATTNSLEAQERLAELRAEGNSKARISQTKRNGMTVYNVK